MPQAWSIIRCVLLGQNQNRDQITLLYCNSAYHNIPQILYKVFSCLQINVMVLHDTPLYSHIFVLRSRMFLEIFFAPLQSPFHQKSVDMLIFGIDIHTGNNLNFEVPIEESSSNVIIIGPNLRMGGEEKWKCNLMSVINVKKLLHCCLHDIPFRTTRSLVKRLANQFIFQGCWFVVQEFLRWSSKNWLTKV